MYPFHTSYQQIRKIIICEISSVCCENSVKRTKEKQEGVAHKPAYLYTYDDL